MGSGRIEQRGEKKEEKKKKLSRESNLGTLTLRGNSRYAYNSEGVTDRYSKTAWGRTLNNLNTHTHTYNKY